MSASGCLCESGRISRYVHTGKCLCVSVNKQLLNTHLEVRLTVHSDTHAESICVCRPSCKSTAVQGSACVYLQESDPDAISVSGRLWVSVGESSELYL